MKTFFAALLFSVVLLFSCTDRDDKLERVQIRVQNTTETTFSEIDIDALIFSDVVSGELTFYQSYEGVTLPENVVLTRDSISMTIAIDSVFEIDTTQLNLFTYRIKELSDAIETSIEVLKD